MNHHSDPPHEPEPAFDLRALVREVCATSTIVDPGMLGPAGKPAPTGSPLSTGHQHARALRLVAKTVLRDLWREARRIHEAPTERAT